MTDTFEVLETGLLPSLGRVVVIVTAFDNSYGDLRAEAFILIPGPEWRHEGQAFNYHADHSYGAFEVSLESMRSWAQEWALARIDSELLTLPNRLATFDVGSIGGLKNVGVQKLIAMGVFGAARPALEWITGTTGCVTLRTILKKIGRAEALESMTL